MKLAEVTSHTLERYYQKLLTTPAVPMICVKKYSNETRTVTTATVRKIHNVLRSAFTQAMKWDLIEKNPAAYATVPKHEAKEREIWDAQTIFKAIELCKDPRLKLCLNLAFSCTLRIGELLALTWDCVDISDESIQAGKSSISITKELQRVSKKVMKALDSKDIITVFPDQGLHNRTALVLKAPKMPTSIRKVFLPKTVAKMLVAWKMEQDAAIEAIGNEYADFNLVIATPVGLPCESAQIRKALKNLIEENNLPPVVFHSLRHSSITYKLKLNQGDIKSVADDNMDSCGSVSKMLRVAGLRPEWTTSGKEVVFRTRMAMEENDPFKVYIIDWMMPDMNGIEVVRRVRSEIGNEIPIIILTAYDWHHIEKEAREAGVTAFCAKPLFRSELLNALRNVEYGAVPKEAAHDPKEQFKGKRVLIVDDVALNREIATAVIEDAGIIAETAENGQAAVAMIAQSKDGYYDLILMDVMMPIMDGYQATQEIRRLENRKLAGIPIIAMTANAFEDDRQAAVRAGMDDHLAKPFQIEKLYEMMTKYL